MAVQQNKKTRSRRGVDHSFGLLPTARTLALTGADTREK